LVRFGTAVGDGCAASDRSARVNPITPIDRNEKTSAQIPKVVRFIDKNLPHFRFATGVPFSSKHELPAERGGSNRRRIRKAPAAASKRDGITPTDLRKNSLQRAPHFRRPIDIPTMTAAIEFCKKEYFLPSEVARMTEVYRTALFSGSN
jgi:hypothetical protein